MILHKDTLILFASWEDRCRLGFEKLLNELVPIKVIMYFLKEYADWTENNRNLVSNLCFSKNVNLSTHGLYYSDPAKSWKILYQSTISEDLSNKKVAIDISTMPREFIWILFSLLEGLLSNITYIYNKPKDYNKEWLSRDPDRPRLVIKLAGEAKLGASTTLLILPGMDPDRTDQLIQFFEPKQCLIGLQAGNEFSNQELNVARHRKRFGGLPGIDFFGIDAYSKDHGFNVIEERISPIVDNKNIIMSSLGPKLSAVALYRLHKKYPQTALAYAPSKEFNLYYSYGIGNCTIDNL